MPYTGFPTDGVELTHLVVVCELDRARQFYRDVLGTAVSREYSVTSRVLQFPGSWLLLVTGGGLPRVSPPSPSRRLRTPIWSATS